jgi:hypothetical protein
MESLIVIDPIIMQNHGPFKWRNIPQYGVLNLDKPIVSSVFVQ